MWVTHNKSLTNSYRKPSKKTHKDWLEPLSASWWLSLLLVLAFWGLALWSLLHGLIPLLVQTG